MALDMALGPATGARKDMALDKIGALACWSKRPLSMVMSKIAIPPGVSLSQVVW